MIMASGYPRGVYEVLPAVVLPEADPISDCVRRRRAARAMQAWSRACCPRHELDEAITEVLLDALG
jgi:hypothetical protein